MSQTGKKLEHLERTAREHPEYRDVLSLFRAVFAFIAGREGETGISFAVPGPLGAERVAGGIPFLSPGDVRVDAVRAAEWVHGVIDVLRTSVREGDAELDALGRALREGTVDLRSLYAAFLERDRAAVEGAAAALSVPPALLEFVMEIPLKTALERFAETVAPADVEGWTERHCPVCGGRAGMDELVGDEGKRFLSCSACFFKWSFRRLECPFCGNADPDSLSYFTAGDGPTRVGTCRKCARYIKTRDSRKGNADVPLEAEDIATLHLDLLAGREGFERGT